jgi:hypothetical protein
MFPLVFVLHSHPAATPASSPSRSVRTISLFIVKWRTFALVFFIGIPIVGSVDWRHQLTHPLCNAVSPPDIHSPLSILNKPRLTWFVVDQCARLLVQLQRQAADQRGKIRRRRRRQRPARNVSIVSARDDIASRKMHTVDE